MKVASQESLFSKPAPSEFLLFRRKQFAQVGEGDETLGIWQRCERDADLPAWLRSDREYGVQTSGRASEAAFEHHSDEGALAIRETVSPAGLRALCWISGSLVLEATPIHATLRELRVRHPHVIAGTWFVDDRERGGPRDGQ